MAFYHRKKRTGQSRLTLFDIIVAFLVIGLALYLGSQSNNNPSITPSTLPKNTIRGKALINDGDTITIQTKRIRLLDMDAPELYQNCGEKSGRPYECGKESKQYLIKLINGREVECHWQKRDQYNRLLAYCFADEDSLNRQMVIDGWAVSYYGFPNEEREARNNKRGLWKTDFERPRQWRDKNMR